MTTADKAYYSMYIIGFAIMMAYSVVRCKKYYVSRLRAVIYTLLTYFYGVGGAMIMGRIYTAIAAARGSGDESKVAIFGAVIFTPLFLIISMMIENLGRRLMKKDKISMRDTMDLLTPGIFIILTCAKFGCALIGCCHGIGCSFGVYHPDLHMYVFPVQICEVVSMMLMLYFVSQLESRGKLSRGEKYLVTAGIYSIIRFIWEFFRYYDVPEMKHYHLGTTYWQSVCIPVLCCMIVGFFIVHQMSQYRRIPQEPDKKRKRK